VTDGKKPDAPGAVPPPVPDANLKATTPYYPSPAQLKDARKPEYANTVIAPNPPPAPFELSKTQPSMANPVLAKLQAVEPLRPGRGGKERPPVRPVTWEAVEATLPKLRPP
jgi:hypothetical protein